MYTGNLLVSQPGSWHVSLHLVNLFQTLSYAVPCPGLSSFLSSCGFLRREALEVKHETLSGSALWLIWVKIMVFLDFSGVIGHSLW